MMRILLFLLFAFLQNFTCSGQDTIVKMNGDSMVVQVDKITNSWIRYKHHYFLDGPYRNIEKIEVSHIIYTTSKIELISEKSIKKGDSIILKVKDPIYGRGIYIDILPGYSHLVKGGTPNMSDYVGLGFRFGTKMYFGQNQKFRHGFSINWLKIGIYGSRYGANLIGAVLNPGYTGIFKFNDNQAFETKVNLGFSFANNTELTAGFNVDPGLFYRKNNLSIGFLYSFHYGKVFNLFGGSYSYANIHTYSLSIGFKF